MRWRLRLGSAEKEAVESRNGGSQATPGGICSGHGEKAGQPAETPANLSASSSQVPPWMLCRAGPLLGRPACQGATAAAGVALAPPCAVRSSLVAAVLHSHWLITQRDRRPLLVLPAGRWTWSASIHDPSVRCAALTGRVHALDVGHGRTRPRSARAGGGARTSRRQTRSSHTRSSSMLPTALYAAVAAGPAAGPADRQPRRRANAGDPCCMRASVVNKSREAPSQSLLNLWGSTDAAASDVAQISSGPGHGKSVAAGTASGETIPCIALSWRARLDARERLTMEAAVSLPRACLCPCTRRQNDTIRRREDSSNSPKRDEQRHVGTGAGARDARGKAGLGRGTGFEQLGLGARRAVHEWAAKRAAESGRAHGEPEGWRDGWMAGWLDGMDGMAWHGMARHGGRDNTKTLARVCMRRGGPANNSHGLSPGSVAVSRRPTIKSAPAEGVESSVAGFALHDARLAAVVGDRTGPRESPRDGPGAHARVGMVPCTPSIRGPLGRVSNLTEEEEEEEEVTDRPEGPGREEKGREGNGDLFGHGRDEEGSHNSRCSTVTRTNTQGKGTEGRPPPPKKEGSVAREDEYRPPPTYDSWQRAQRGIIHIRPLIAQTTTSLWAHVKIGAARVNKQGPTEGGRAGGRVGRSPQSSGFGGLSARRGCGRAVRPQIPLPPAPWPSPLPACQPPPPVRARFIKKIWKRKRHTDRQREKEEGRQGGRETEKMSRRARHLVPAFGPPLRACPCAVPAWPSSVVGDGNSIEGKVDGGCREVDNDSSLPHPILVLTYLHRVAGHLAMMDELT
ncbi:hypothetical protein PCL_05060 [Purpureocillium lilacinum]|uniref:Uncharacterized protein n=1 Tax=Purpureocillium lilacinum TaxID=33203 RepID=A0A2U3DVU3_PURLI|nr:hypothetical protein PCL_05060 [Purpureocillium lilacinum]